MLQDDSDRHYNDFDVNSIEWDTFPQYIQDIVYMGLSKISSETVANYSAPLIYIQVGVQLYSIYVCKNVAFGQYINTSGVSSYLRLFRFIPFSDSVGGSVVYHAQFTKSDNSVVSDWTEIVPEAMGNMNNVEWYPGSTINNNQSIDLYIYGNNSVKVGDYVLVEIPLSDSNSTKRLRCYLNNKNGGSYQLPYCGIISSSDSELYPDVWVKGFQPLTPTQLQNVRDEQRHNDQKSWFERLGDRIGEFFSDLLEGLKSLFIPSSDYFSSLFNDLDSFFSERFGFLYALPRFIIDVFQVLISFEPVSSDYVISFPAISAPEVVNGSVVWHQITNETEFDLSFIFIEQFGFIYDLYIMACYLSFSFLIVNLCRRKYLQIFGG